MSALNILATDLKLNADPSLTIPSGNVKSYHVLVEFDNDWKNYKKTAVFFTESNPDKIYEVLISNNMAEIPTEVLDEKGVLFIGIRGVYGKSIKASNLLKIKIVDGAPSGTLTPVEPTPDVYQQILGNFGQLENTVAELTDKKADKTDLINGMNYKGSTNRSDLPGGASVGDFWYCKDEESCYAWNGSGWYDIGPVNHGEIDFLIDKVEDSTVRVKKYGSDLNLKVGKDCMLVFTDFTPGSTIHISGKNLLDIPSEISHGERAYIFVAQNTTVTLSFDYTGDSDAFGNWNIYRATTGYDSDKIAGEEFDSLTGSGHYSKTITLTSNALMFDCEFYGSITVTNIMLEIGDTETEYQAFYENDVYTVSGVEKYESGAPYPIANVRTTNKTNFSVEYTTRTSDYVDEWAQYLIDHGITYDDTEIREEIAELKKYVGNGKELLAVAITDKGVDTASSDTFTIMAENIKKIGGKENTVFMVSIGRSYSKEG